MGCATAIVEYVGVPRFLFSDFPLGNPAGRPNDPESQAFTLKLALRLLETAPGPRTTVQSPLRWSDNPDWKLDFSNIARLSPEEIARPAAAPRTRPAKGTPPGGGKKTGRRPNGPRPSRRMPGPIVQRLRHSNVSC